MFSLALWPISYKLFFFVDALVEMSQQITVSFPQSNDHEIIILLIYTFSILCKYLLGREREKREKIDFKMAHIDSGTPQRGEWTHL